MEVLAKMHWLSAVGGLAVGAVVVGAAWEITHIMTKSGPVVASVGSTVIHRPEFDQRLDQSGGSQTLSSMIETQLIKDAASKAGVTATTAQINQLKQSIEAQNGMTSDSALQTALASSGVTMSQFTDELRVQVLAQNIAESKVKVTDAQIQNYYNANKKSLNNKPLAQVKSQITQSLKQQGAESVQQLLAQLAKTDPITINDPSFASVKTNIENPAPTSALGQ